MAALGAQAITQASSAYGRSQAIERQGDFQENQANINARYAEFESEEAMLQGDAVAKKLQRRYAKMRGSQRARLAAQGIAIDTGSAGQIQKETMELAAEDLEDLKLNAWRKSFGFKQEAARTRAAGRYARQDARARSRDTLIAGATRATGTGLRGALRRAESQPQGDDDA